MIVRHIRLKAEAVEQRLLHQSSSPIIGSTSAPGRRESAQYLPQSSGVFQRNCRSHIWSVAMNVCSGSKPAQLIVTSRPTLPFFRVVGGRRVIRKVVEESARAISVPESGFPQRRALQKGVRCWERWVEAAMTGFEGWVGERFAVWPAIVRFPGLSGRLSCERGQGAHTSGRAPAFHVHRHGDELQMTGVAGASQIADAAHSHTSGSSSS